MANNRETKQEALEHFRFVLEAINDLGIEAYLNAKTFQLEIHYGEFSETFFPQFLVKIKGKKSYSNNFTNDVLSFIGWRPYFSKVAEFFTDKVNVKQLLMEHQVPVPNFSLDKPLDTDFIIKRRNSSFSDNIRGPYRAGTVLSLDSQQGEYYDAFIKGTIVKAWLVNEEPICAEYLEMPTIIGDGQHTIAELIDMHTSTFRKIPEHTEAQHMLHYARMRFNDVLEKDQNLCIDFRYGSPFFPRRAIQEAYFEAGDRPELYTQLQKIGAVLWTKVKPQIRDCLIYTVDAILDGQGKLNVLEANTNPMVHPAVYPQVIKMLPALRRAMNLSTVKAGLS